MTFNIIPVITMCLKMIQFSKTKYLILNNKMQYLTSPTDKKSMQLNLKQKCQLMPQQEFKIS